MTKLLGYTSLTSPLTPYQHALLGRRIVYAAHALGETATDVRDRYKSTTALHRAAKPFADAAETLLWRSALDDVQQAAVDHDQHALCASPYFGSLKDSKWQALPAAPTLPRWRALYDAYVPGHPRIGLLSTGHFDQVLFQLASVRPVIVDAIEALASIHAPKGVDREDVVYLTGCRRRATKDLQRLDRLCALLEDARAALDAKSGRHWEAQGALAV